MTIAIAFSFGTNGYRLVINARESPKPSHYLDFRPTDRLRRRTCSSTLLPPCSTISKAIIKCCACKPCIRGNLLQTRPRSSGTWDVVLTYRPTEWRIRRFTGIEFSLVHSQPPFFVIQKRERLSPDEGGS